jgi:hypothetical protein
VIRAHQVRWYAATQAHVQQPSVQPLPHFSRWSWCQGAGAGGPALVQLAQCSVQALHGRSTTSVRYAGSTTRDSSHNVQNGVHILEAYHNQQNSTNDMRSESVYAGRVHRLQLLWQLHCGGTGSTVVWPCYTLVAPGATLIWSPTEPHPKRGEHPRGGCRGHLLCESVVTGSGQLHRYSIFSVGN